MNAKELGDMPAFPLPVIKDDKGHPMVHAHPYNQGMTLRMYLAGRAMQGCGIVDDGRFSEHDHARGYPNTIAGWVAAAALRNADALLALLAKDAE